MELDKERIAREIIQEDIGKNVVFSIDGRISAMPKFNAKHIIAAMFKFQDKMCESKKASTSDEALPISDVVNQRELLLAYHAYLIGEGAKLELTLNAIYVDEFLESK